MAAPDFALEKQELLYPVLEEFQILIENNDLVDNDAGLETC
ncbi:MAG TPA: hypothetical protein VFT89_09020 [Rhizobiaceae bacterium]|nr:hypothetical protein [Rhizobiaceae bacterium]